MASPGFASLPEKVQVAIFAKLSLKDRQHAAALVCRHWRRLANAATVAGCAAAPIWLTAEGARALPVLHSFAAWTAAHGSGHVRQLVLEVFTSESNLPFDQLGAARAAVAAALRPCAPSLVDLAVNFDSEELLLDSDLVDAPSCQWVGLGSCTRLRSLALRCDCELRLDVSLAALTGLQRLSLDGAPCRIAADVDLPGSITHLSLSNFEGGNVCMEEEEGLAPQVATLTRLRSLHMWGAQFDSPAGFAPLAPLSASLTELVLRNCTQVPACLGQLTSLARLSITADMIWGEQWGERPGDQVLRALPRLGQLRHLALCPMERCTAPSAALSQLQPAAAGAQLQTFCWVDSNSMTARGTALPLPLPAAAAPQASLGGLRWLSAPVDVLARSLPALAAAPRLFFLGVDTFRCGDDSSVVLAGLLGCVAKLPGLRYVVLGSAAWPVHQQAVAALRSHGRAVHDLGTLSIHFAATMPPGVRQEPPVSAGSQGAAPGPGPAPVAGAGALPPLMFRRYSQAFQFERFLMSACIAPASADDSLPFA